jgi:hypothetical protein
MKPGQTVRYTCNACDIQFDLSIAPLGDWAGIPEDDCGDAEFAPCHCPFCGDPAIKPMHDRAITT